MADVLIRDAAAYDAVDLAPRLRKSDVDEVYAARGLSPRAGLMASFSASEVALTGLLDGRIVTMFGVAAGEGFGSPWLLASPEIEARPVLFLRRNKRFVDAMRGRYGVLRNYVDARHDASLRWLRWLGFSIGEAVPWGFERRPFHPFVME